MKPGKTGRIITAVVIATVLLVSVYIMVRGLGLSPDHDFGAGAYYYADIPDFEKYTGGKANPTSVPTVVYILLFLAWGALMWLLWKWVDGRK